jgi:hypothetical protein
MSPDPTTPTSTRPAADHPGSPGTIELTVLVAGGAQLPALIGPRRTLSLPYRDEDGSGVFELSLTAVRDSRSVEAVGGPVVGAVVVVDPARPTERAPLVTGLVARGLPCAVVVDTVDGALQLPAAAVRRALRLTGTTPVLAGDCRDSGLLLTALTALTAHALHLREGGAASEEQAGWHTVAS